jgi:uncharacterized protein YerC
MSKVKTHSIDKKEKYQIIGDFFDIVANLRSKKEIIDFFMGLLTPSESVMMARRIQVAKRIFEKKSYDEIRRELKVSYQTITKTDHWLHSRGDEYCHWLDKCFIRGKAGKFGGSNGGRGGSLLNKYAQHKFLKDLIK